MLRNVPGVLLASVAATLIAWGSSGSVRAAAVTSGAVLAVLTIGLLIDVGRLRR